MLEFLRKPFPLLTLLIMSTAAAFGNSLANQFVWDDFLFVTYGTAYRNLDLRGVILSPGNGLEYLPVRDLSYLLDNFLWGANSLGFHLSNIVVYVLTVLVIYGFTREMTNRFGDGEADHLTPPVTALLFALHPLHSEVVSWVTGRNALLSGLFFFLASWSYLRHLREAGTMRWAWYTGALLSYALSLLSKATGIILPLVLVTLYVTIPKGQRSRQGLLHVLPFFVMSGGAYVFFTSIAAKAHIMDTTYRCSSLSCLLERGAVALQIPFFYLGKLVAPFALAADYDTRFTGAILSLSVIVSLTLLAAGGVLCYRKRKIFPPLPFAFGFFLVTLIPVLNLLPTHPTVADRYAYLPSFGFAYLIAAAGANLWRKSGTSAVPAVFTVLLVVWGVLAFQQNRVWRSDKSLWENSIRVSPDSLLSNSNLGRIYFLEKEYGRAFPLLKRAQQINPNDANYDFFLGCFEVLKGNHHEAIDHFNQALLRDGEFMEALYNLGRAYEAVNEPEKAILTYKRLLQSREADPGNFLTLAREKLQNLGITPAF